MSLDRALLAPVSWFIVLCAALLSSPLDPFSASLPTPCLAFQPSVCDGPSVPPLRDRGGVYVPWKITSPESPGSGLKPTLSSLMFPHSQALAFTRYVRLLRLNSCTFLLSIINNKYWRLFFIIVTIFFKINII